MIPVTGSGFDSNQLRKLPVGLVLTGTLLGAFIWLWPYTHGPLSQFWPNFIAWMTGLALWLLLLTTKREARERTVVAGWLLAAFLSALLGLLQYFDGEADLFPFIAQALPGHAYANTRQVNHLATLLNVGLLCVMWLLRVGRIPFLYAMLLAAPMAIALAGTASRGGAVQLALIGVLTIWVGGREGRGILLRWWTFVFAVYVTSALALPWLLEILSGSPAERRLASRMAVESTCSSRLVLWRNVWDLIVAKPVTGWGWEGLRLGHYMTEFEDMRFCSMLTNAHNLPLHLATELGVPLAVLLLVGFVWLLARGKPWTVTDPTAQLGCSVLLLVGFHSLVEYPLWFGNFQTMVLLALWLAWPELKARFFRGQQDLGDLVLKRFHVLAAGTVAVGLSAMAFDYVRVTQLYVPQSERLGAYQIDTLNKVRHSAFFRDWVLFAQVVAATPDQQNAAVLLEAALEALRISPEPRVIERVIVSASLLGKNELVQAHVKKYKAAWPEAYSAWVNAQATAPQAVAQ